MSREYNLKQYFRKRIKSVMREISTPAPKRTEETFHRLRVEIKKIKALYALMEFSNKKFSRKKSFEPFKVFFKEAGEVRKLQLESQFAISHSLASKQMNIADKLKEEQRKALRRFEKELEKKTIRKIERAGKETEEILETFKEKDYLNYLKTKVAVIRHLIKDEFRKKDLHEARMELKEFLYILRIADSSRAPLVRALNELQEAIGLWHDYDSFITHLKKLQGSPGTGGTRKRQFQQTLKKLSAENENLLQKIEVSRQKAKKALQEKKD